MQIVRARPEEAEALTEIAYSAKRHWGYPESWIERWRDILTIRPDFIASNVAHAALENGRAVGFYLLTSEADGIHLDHLWILPAAMYRGIGRALFKHAVEQTRDLGFRVIGIEADPNAEGFYKRMGATRVGTSVSEIDGEKRELPLLIYQLE
jgi:GNAT superfamily N-acetyltransferase